MRFAGFLAYTMGLCSREELDRQNRLLDRLNLPVGIPHGITPESMIRQMHSDKKVKNGRINFVLPEKIGGMATVDGGYRIPIPEDELRELLYSFDAVRG